MADDYIPSVEDRDAEVALLKLMLLHSAGYGVTLFGMLSIRTTEAGTIEVDAPKGFSWSFALSGLDPAVKFFVALRHGRKLGDEYERESHG